MKSTMRQENFLKATATMRLECYRLLDKLQAQGYLSPEDHAAAIAEVAELSGPMLTATLSSLRD